MKSEPPDEYNITSQSRVDIIQLQSQIIVLLELENEICLKRMQLEKKLRDLRRN